MSQNGPYSGPPWSGGSSDEPYTEPADPWGAHGSSGSEPVWGAHPPSMPQQPVSPSSPALNSGPMWGHTAPAPPRRNTPMVVLVAALALLICIGLGTTAYLLKQRNNRAKAAANTVASTAANPNPAPQGSADARFVAVGQCVVNQGTDEEPDMRRSVCASGTYEVLKRFDGRTTGEKDAESKCAKVDGYTKWYFYDSAYDDLDFVLCLKEHKQV